MYCCWSLTAPKMRRRVETRWTFLVLNCWKELGRLFLKLFQTLRPWHAGCERNKHENADVWIKTPHTGTQICIRNTGKMNFQIRFDRTPLKVLVLPSSKKSWECFKGWGFIFKLHHGWSWMYFRDDGRMVRGSFIDASSSSEKNPTSPPD